MRTDLYNYAKQVLELKKIDYNKKEVQSLKKSLKSTFNTVFKAVAFDVDGTLTEVNSSNIEIEMSNVIANLLTKGIHVILISGRGRGSMRDAVKQIIKHTNISFAYLKRLSCIAHNGVFWLRTTGIKGKILDKEKLLIENEISDIKLLEDEIRNKNENLYDLWLNEKIKISCEPEDIPFLLRINVNKELFENDNIIIKELRSDISEILKEKESKGEKIFLTEATYAGNYLFNISNTNKINALKKFSEEVGIEILEILRIGDQGHREGNDYDLLNSRCGFSVNLISKDKKKCFPIIKPNGKLALKGVEATRELLKQLHIFPPFSLKPKDLDDHLTSLYKFEELASIRARKEGFLLLQQLKIRLHRLLDGKDKNFNFGSLAFSDIFDKSGGIVLRDWEIYNLNDNFTDFFNIKRGFSDINVNKNLKWAVHTDTKVLLRGENYYWGMTHLDAINKEPNFFLSYGIEVSSFLNNSIKLLSDVQNEKPSFVLFKLLLGILDNIRNILIIFLHSAYHCEITHNNLQTKDWKHTCNIYSLLVHHAGLFYDFLLDENTTWKEFIIKYKHLLEKTLIDIDPVKVFINKYSFKVEKSIIRKWREADSFLENVLAIKIGLYEFEEIILTKNSNKRIVCLGLDYGGIELPIIAKILARDKNLHVSSALLNISLYGNKKVMEKALQSNNSKYQLEFEKATNNIVFLDNDISDISNEEFIIMDDNCTTARTLQITRDILVKKNASVIGAIVIRYPGTNRFLHMALKNHGFPDPDILLSFTRGFVNPSPYTRLLKKGSEHAPYLDQSGIFDKSKYRITRLLEKNGSIIQDKN